tara:strand:+ start:558 stop:1895 length:1338 start_codon:yes stop_codon:yes gene_type:complete
MSRGMPGQGVPVAQPQKPSFGQRFENLFARVGGLDVGGLQVGQDFTEQERNLARNKGLQQFLYALGAGVKGEDPVAAGLQVRRMQEEEEQKRLQEEIFKDPKYQNIATILGPQFAFQQRESDIAESKRQKLIDDFKQKNPGMTDLLNLVEAGFPPSILQSKEINPEFYQLVDKNDQFLRNITEQQYLSLQDKNEIPEGAKLTKIPQGDRPAESASIGKISDLVSGLEKEVIANQQLQTGLDDIIKTINETPEASLFVGDALQFADSVIQNIDAATNFLSKASENEVYQNLQNDLFIVKNDAGEDITDSVVGQIQNISKGNAKLESQIKDLAYLFAAARGQEGRGLSDKDFQNALNIISGGVGPEGRIAVINDVKRRFKRDLTNKLNIKKETYQGLYEVSPDNENYNQYAEDIDVLLGLSFFDSNQTSNQPEKLSTEDLLKKYGEG